MLDLALELGMPAETLARSMSARELIQWDRRARERGLPGRRIEWYLAQIALVVARCAGAKDVRLKDFLIEPEQDQALDDLESAKLAFGFNPRKKHG